MAEPQILTATEASRSFSELLHRVCYGGESFVIKKGNRLMARITPVKEFELKDGLKTDAPQEQIEPVLNAEGLTIEEAAYYQTVVEQLKKMIPEPCE